MGVSVRFIEENLCKSHETTYVWAKSSSNWNIARNGRWYRVRGRPLCRQVFETANAMNGMVVTQWSTLQAAFMTTSVNNDVRDTRKWAWPESPHNLLSITFPSKILWEKPFASIGHHQCSSVWNGSIRAMDSIQKLKCVAVFVCWKKCGVMTALWKQFTGGKNVTLAKASFALHSTHSHVVLRVEWKHETHTNGPSLHSLKKENFRLTER